jgi:hypothetical protein
MPFNDLSLLYIPDSYRSDSNNHIFVIFMSQKIVNDSLYSRKFYVFKFNILLNTELNISPEDSSILPQFLDEIPSNYYINGILNTYDYRCSYGSNCNKSAILLLTVNDIPKYCITSEETLSENVNELNLIISRKII